MVKIKTILCQLLILFIFLIPHIIWLSYRFLIERLYINNLKFERKYNNYQWNRNKWLANRFINIDILNKVKNKIWRNSGV
jgi:hypothetical protein